MDGTPDASPQPKSGTSAECAEDIAALLVDLVDHLDALLAYWDGDQRCRFANEAYKDWFGRGRQELLGLTLKELLGQLYEQNAAYIAAAYRGEKQVFERAIPRLDGRGVRHVLATYLPRIVDGKVIGIFVHVADVEPLKRLEVELKAARDEAEKLATHDHLTGLPNRLAMDERMADAMARAKRTGDKMYVMSVDVDRFKAVNDTYGHAVGDRFLVEIAARITSCVRDYDTVARIGGDEFLLLITATALDEGIESLARRILQAARQPWPIDEAFLTPAVSIGIAEFPQHGVTRDALMLASDRALYAAKAAGRDCFRIAEPEAPGP